MKIRNTMWAICVFILISSGCAHFAQRDRAYYQNGSLRPFMIRTASRSDSSSTTAIVSGYVFDDDTKEALPGAQITIPAFDLGTSTVVDGSFRLEHIPIGRWEFNIRFMGYYVGSFEIEIRPHTETQLFIGLHTIPIYHGERKR